MKSLYKVAVATSVLLIGSAIPGMAQISNGLDFTTSFPFYVQNTKLPAGSYTITQADLDTGTLLIQSADEKYSAFFDYIPTRAGQAHKQSDVTFHKYGNVEYLNRVWVEGQKFGMKVIATKTERKAGTTAAPVEHSITGKKR